MKKYPCCNRSQCALDSLFGLMTQHRFSYDDVEKIIVDVNLYDSHMMKYIKPKTGDEARFSFPHVLGVALLKGKVWVDSFTEESVANAKIQEARAKIEVAVHPDWPTSRLDVRTPITVKLKDGSTFTAEAKVPREPTLKDLTNRYRDAAEGLLKPDRVNETIDLLMNLEKLKDVSALMNILTFTK